MELKILVWTCILVFIATSIITLLGIIGRIKIDKKYLDKLFIALILEIIAIGIFGFNQFMTKQNEPTFIRITFPVNDINLNGSNKVFLQGIALMNKDKHLIECVAYTENDSLYLTANQTNNRNGFNFEIPIDTSSLPSILKINCKLIEGDLAIEDDQIQVTLKK